MAGVSHENPSYGVLELPSTLGRYLHVLSFTLFFCNVSHRFNVLLWSAQNRDAILKSFLPKTTWKLTT